MYLYTAALPTPMARPTRNTRNVNGTMLGSTRMVVVPRASTCFFWTRSPTRTAGSWATPQAAQEDSSTPALRSGYVSGPTPMALSVTAVTTPARLALTPSPGVVMRMLGIDNRKHPTTHTPSTPYIVRRAPQRSDIQPPSARTTPEGKLNTAANSPAVARDVPNTVV